MGLKKRDDHGEPLDSAPTDEVSPVSLTPGVEDKPVTALDVSMEEVPESWDSISGHTARPAESTAALPVPNNIGRYRVLQRLGIGGMAEVFLAEQSGPAGFAKRVVVKRMLPHLTIDQRVVELFLREARIAARLTHPNIVQTYELGDDEGRYFIAMEYVDGLSAFQLAKRLWAVKRALPVDVIRRVVGDAALGLHYAHELRGDDGRPLGIVHRDISPDNVMVTREGVSKVLDFGIAKPTASPGLTRVGELKGKIPFMSPEMLRGEPIDRRADLYALGVSLYWLLTGRWPFRGDNDFMTVDLALRQEPAPPSKLVRAVPPDIDELVVRLLAKNKEQRVATGLEVHRLLTRNLAVDTTVVQKIVETAMALPDQAEVPVPSTLGTAPSVTAPLVMPPRSQRDHVGRRRPLARIVAVTAAGTIALTVAAVVGVWSGGDAAPQQAPPTMTPAATTADVGAAPMPVARAADVASPPVPAPPPSGAAEDAPALDEPAARAVAEATAPSPRSGRAEAATVKVTVRAPPRIIWRALGGAELGRGTASLRVPVGVRTIVAVDPKSGGSARVAVAPAVDYDKLPRGTLEVRAFPFAEVTLGEDKLGTTPIAPRDVVAASYQLTLVYQGRVIKKTVKVEPGKIQRITVKMNEP